MLIDNMAGKKPQPLAKHQRLGMPFKCCTIDGVTANRVIGTARVATNYHSGAHDCRTSAGSADYRASREPFANCRQHWAVFTICCQQPCRSRLIAASEPYGAGVIDFGNFLGAPGIG